MAGSTQAKPQLPSTQVGVAPGGAMHTVAQSPQWAVLVIKSMQEPPQSFVPAAQPTLQVPPAQTWPAPQTVVQLPQ
jgi:hypothetical protein